MKVYLIAPRNGSTECPVFSSKEQAEDTARAVSRWVQHGCRVEEILVTERGASQWTSVACFVEGVDVPEQSFYAQGAP